MKVRPYIVQINVAVKNPLVLRAGHKRTVYMTGAHTSKDHGCSYSENKADALGFSSKRYAEGFLKNFEPAIHKQFANFNEIVSFEIIARSDELVKGIMQLLQSKEELEQ